MQQEMQHETQQPTAQPMQDAAQPHAAPCQEAQQAEARPDSAQPHPAPNADLPEWLDDPRYQRPDPIRVRTITVRRGRLVCEVQVADPEFRRTTPKLAAFATRQYPDLPLHACVNDVGSAFGSVIESTSVPHMLEHLTIDVQTRNAGRETDSFVGTTEWLDERAGTARVEISFRDDLEALKAFNEATRFLNTAVLTCLS